MLTFVEKFYIFIGASSQIALGHSSHVMNVRFNSDSTVLYSVGGNDRSVFKWRLNVD